MHDHLIYNGFFPNIISVNIIGVVCDADEIGCVCCNGTAKEGLKYTNFHEWVKADGDTATIGLTDYGQVGCSKRHILAAS